MSFLLLRSCAVRLAVPRSRRTSIVLGCPLQSVRQRRIQPVSRGPSLSWASSSRLQSLHARGGVKASPAQSGESPRTSGKPRLPPRNPAEVSMKGGWSRRSLRGSAVSTWMSSRPRRRFNLDVIAGAQPSEALVRGASAVGRSGSRPWPFEAQPFETLAVRDLGRSRSRSSRSSLCPARVLPQVKAFASETRRFRSGAASSVFGTWSSRPETPSNLSILSSPGGPPPR
ncbi:uncharacterized protein CMC5_014390 [Chondromyces crocatus]|uniref:Uncharacterized protein n=1 Tax=Chondromyces crocatus TaxID=52 RepID=A0A0K1E9F3_CHOCO|nr:uncharacterized protein CMC5_014390 [Chondromyces crocatus]